MTHPFVYGTTEVQDFTLKADGVPRNLTGCSIAVSIYDTETGTPLAGAGTASIVTAAEGHVRFAPTGSGFELGKIYEFRWTVTDSGGKVSKVPNSELPDLWKIVR